MKVVADTNILIASVFWNGTPYQIVQMALDGHVEIFISRETLREVRKVLNKEFHLNEQEIDDISRGLLLCCTLIDPTEIPPVVKRDPKDDHVIACAISARVECIITRDKDILDLKQYQSVKFMTPEEFLSSLFDPVK